MIVLFYSAITWLHCMLVMCYIFDIIISSIIADFRVVIIVFYLLQLKQFDKIKPRKSLSYLRTISHSYSPSIRLTRGVRMSKIESGISVRSRTLREALKRGQVHLASKLDAKVSIGISHAISKFYEDCCDCKIY